MFDASLSLPARKFQRLRSLEITGLFRSADKSLACISIFSRITTGVIFRRLRICEASHNGTGWVTVTRCPHVKRAKKVREVPLSARVHTLQWARASHKNGLAFGYARTARVSRGIARKYTIGRYTHTDTHT
jgi:hypothetical protein